MSRKKTRPDKAQTGKHDKHRKQDAGTSPWAAADKKRSAGAKAPYSDRKDEGGKIESNKDGQSAWGRKEPNHGTRGRAAALRGEAVDKAERKPWERSEGTRGGRNRADTGRASGKRFTGIVSAHPDGFGFVDVPGREKGLFLPREEMRTLMHGDEVEVQLSFSRGRESAELVRIIRQAPSVIIGQYILQGGVGMVQPRSRRIPQNILIGSRDSAGAADGDWVRIEIQRGQQPLRGRVQDVLGNVTDPTSLIDLVVSELQLPDEFPAAVEREAEALPDKVKKSDLEGRLDLRHLPFVTIDGETARDFDDAICVQARGDGFEAWVAIADVSNYVLPHSAMDTEALERSNSFYFPDRVIPMLPEKLSNGLCSLNPKVDRLAMVVRMRFDVAGRRRTARMYTAVIHSQARLTYTLASAWLEDRDEKAVPEEGLRSMLDSAAQLFTLLAKMRKSRGALDLDVPEVRAVLHEGSVARMNSDERNIAHHLIEEMMLAANTAVAEYMDTHHCPLLYRVHPAPKRESIEKLNDFLLPFGLFVKLPKIADKDSTVRPGDVQFVLEQAVDKPFAHPLQRMVLRSMQQARYTTENEGHFGLAYKSYCHFTSPIRRYADLTVHRRLKALISKENPDKVQPVAKLAEIGVQTSVQERKQQRAEWDVQAMLAALYHHKDIGREMPARISGLSQRRIFFELQESLAEAGMPSDLLEGTYELDESGHRLVSRRSGHAWQLGDEVTLRIDSTDPVRGQINVTLILADTPATEA